MQQGKSNCLCRSEGIRASYCRRIMTVQVLERKSLAIPLQKMLRFAAGCLYTRPGGSRAMTPACAPQHLCWPTHTFIHIYAHAFTHTHSHTRITFTYIHIHTHSHSRTFRFTHIHIHTHLHTFALIQIHIHTHSHSHTFTHIHAHPH